MHNTLNTQCYMYMEPLLSLYIHLRRQSWLSYLNASITLAHGLPEYLVYVSSNLPITYQIVSRTHSLMAMTPQHKKRDASLLVYPPGRWRSSVFAALRVSQEMRVRISLYLLCSFCCCLMCGMFLCPGCPLMNRVRGCNAGVGYG
jgi:hypothetical protein